MPLDPAHVQIGDNVTLQRKKTTAEGTVTRIDHSTTKGTGFHITGYPYPLWVGPWHSYWTITAHHPTPERNHP